MRFENCILVFQYKKDLIKEIIQRAFVSEPPRLEDDVIYKCFEIWGNLECPITVYENVWMKGIDAQNLIVEEIRHSWIQVEESG